MRNMKLNIISYFLSIVTIIAIPFISFYGIIIPYITISLFIISDLKKDKYYLKNTSIICLSFWIVYLINLFLNFK